MKTYYLQSNGNLNGRSSQVLVVEGDMVITAIPVNNSNNHVVGAQHLELSGVSLQEVQEIIGKYKKNIESCCGCGSCAVCNSTIYLDPISRDTAQRMTQVAL